MNDERKPIAAPWVAGVILALLGLYVWAYYAMVRPVPLTTAGYVWNIAGYYAEPNTRSDYLLVRFFLPIHVFDRVIRPHIWRDAEFHRIRTRARNR